MPPAVKALLLATIAGLLAACSDLPSMKVEGGPPAKIAVVGPMSGRLTLFGGELRGGAEQAMADINRHGGLLDRVLTMRAVDDKCDAERAAIIARGLLNEHVVFVVGHFCSNASIAAAPIYSNAKLLMISPSSSDPALTEAGLPYVFRTVPRQDEQGPVLVKYALDHFANRPIAVIEEETPYGKAVAGSIRQALAKASVKPTLDQTIPGGRADLATLAAQLKSRGIGVILYGGGYKQAAGLLVEARKQGVDALLGGGDTLLADDFWHIAGPAAEGSFATFLPDFRNAPEAKDAVAGLGQYGVDAAGYTLYAYAAMQAVAQAAQKAQTFTAGPLADALHAGTFDTAIGRISFDAKGDVRGVNYVIYGWHEGRYRRL